MTSVVKKNQYYMQLNFMHQIGGGFMQLPKIQEGVYSHGELLPDFLSLSDLTVLPPNVDPTQFRNVTQGPL